MSRPGSAGTSNDSAECRYWRWPTERWMPDAVAAGQVAKSSPERRPPFRGTSDRSVPFCRRCRRRPAPAWHRKTLPPSCEQPTRSWPELWSVLSTPRRDSAEPDWFSDPVTGRRAPDRQLAFQIHHRDEAETGNIKQIWEMSRHHHITVLAAAWWLTQEERYAEVAAGAAALMVERESVFDWGALDKRYRAGIRLISWTWARRLLEDRPKVSDLFEHNDDAVRQIAWHQEFLAAFPSRGSSANNHIVAEAAGRLVAACAFPWYAVRPGGGKALLRSWSVSWPPTRSRMASTVNWSRLPSLRPRAWVGGCGGGRRRR